MHRNPAKHACMFTKTTHDIKITVVPTYLSHQSRPVEGHHEWAYTVYIENLGDKKVQLLNRYWHITDGSGRVQEVRGPGVVGEQPIIAPGEMFRYTSGTFLSTPSGIMTGSYEMEAENARFEVTIPVFSLDSSHQISRPN